MQKQGTSADLVDTKTQRPIAGEIGGVPSPRRRDWSSLGRLFVPLLVIVVVGTLVAVATENWDRWTAQASVQSTDNAYIRAELTRLSARVSGNLKSAPVQDFEHVKAGQLLMEIDPSDYEVKVAQAKASLDSAVAQLQNLANQERLQHAAIDQANAQFQAASVTAELARQEAVRQTALLQSGSGTKQKQEQADAEKQQTAAAAQASQASVVSARAQLDVVSGQRAQLQASVDAAKSNLDAAQLNLSYTKVVAPFDGIVSERQVHVGDYISVASNLLTVVPLPNVYVTANFKETQLARMSVGQRVIIKVDTFPGQVFRGHVESLSPASGSQFALLPADNATGNFTKVTQRIPVRIAFDEDASVLEKLRPGMSSVVAVQVDNVTGG
ncbi:HlyD family secretion protein [Rhizobium rhizogenes]|uniref:Multidrug resistance efflux pump protein n=1 Tax=Rhizobium rhizogenes (strain K84 / ATCC BAA-868) TaxID=311403 RepID=B9JMK5_RHIR8|nr:multidrug resistance efflux pump protein [Rhizobium rhizogenes K84]EJK88083.1 multidrug resistance efflux pump [Rhizobium sp. AP16]NTI24458.1 HlyD family secretion protein [Rhizobium rhizogenes]OCJ19130.1 hemolysin D [Agrobacterium sp. B131/95]NTI43778.1 HlyD family secretion protein [Rhizobium rhizogenes]